MQKEKQLAKAQITMVHGRAQVQLSCGRRGGRQSEAKHELRKQELGLVRFVAMEIRVIKDALEELFEETLKKIAQSARKKQRNADGGQADAKNEGGNEYSRD